MTSISLYCTEGSANKEYHAEIVAKDGGFVVNFKYGPRGKALKGGTKTDAPVALAAATKIYDKLVAEKTGKGYTTDISGAAYTDTANAGRVSGWRPALLTSVDENQVQALLNSGDWVASEKKDGERRAVEVTAEGIAGINRKGLYVDVPAAWLAVLGKLPIGTIVDAEHIGDELFIFDCPQFGQQDLRGIGYTRRHEWIRSAIADVLGSDSKSLISVLPISSDPAVKRALLAAVTKAHGEGIVLRRAGGSYEAGLSDGSVKFKLVESATCIVARVNSGVRSVALALIDSKGAQVAVGNATVPANYAVPAAGDLVEIRYMHMFEAGSLYQPAYKGARTDLETSAATLAQVTRIKLKRTVAAEGDDVDEVPAPEVLVAVAASARRMKP